MERKQEKNGKWDPGNGVVLENKEIRSLAKNSETRTYDDDHSSVYLFVSSFLFSFSFLFLFPTPVLWENRWGMNRYPEGICHQTIHDQRLHWAILG